MSEPVIVLKDLQYAYPDRTRALQGISFNFFEGETYGIIGPNGAGKSTLLLHFNGILSGEGLVEVLGIKVERKNLPFIRRKIGLVFQEPDHQLFMTTVFDDVAFGPLNMDFNPEQVRGAVHQALEKVDMREAGSRMSHHLSFGEKKRVALASVLSMGPEVLVLDEPSSNLDPRHRRDFIEFMKTLRMTKIIATHDLDLVFETCTKVLLMDRGRIMAAGNTLDILKNRVLLEDHGLEVPSMVRVQLS